MKRFLAMVLAAWMVCATALGETSDVDEEVRKIFKMYKAVGGTVLAAKDGEIVYQYNYGFANRQSKTPVTEDTYFRVASVTKMVSAIRIMQLVEAGALDLDADLSDYLGFTLRNPYAREVPITLRHLMTHTSSLNQNGSYGRRGLEALLALEGNHRANYYDEVPGTKYRYSNFGAGVMGSVLEAVTGKNVQDTVAEGVFEPLGIDGVLQRYDMDALPVALLQDLPRRRKLLIGKRSAPLRAQRLRVILLCRAVDRLGRSELL